MSPQQLDPYRAPPPPGPPPQGLDGRAIAGMVLGIVGTVLCCLPAVGLVCGTIAIVMFAKFNSAFHASGQTLGGRGMAIAGLVTGIISTAIGLINTIYWVVAGLILGTASRALPWK